MPRPRVITFGAALAPTKPTPGHVPASITVLYLHAIDGTLIGYWFHPNPEAIDQKEDELSADGASTHNVTRVTYTKEQSNESE